MNWLRSLTILTALMILAPAAYADDSMQCEVVEIEASNTSTPTIDAALNDLAKKLSQMPFSAFNTFKQSARQTRAISTGSTQTFNVNHANVDVGLNTITAATKKKKARVSLGVGITSNNKKWVDTKGSVDVGDFLMYARTGKKDSAVIYAVGCH